MTTIQEKLRKHKESLSNSVQAPPELEGRLRSALEKVPTVRKKKHRIKAWAVSAAAVLILMVGMYQYPAFAYYGSKLLGTGELYSLNFSELTEQGYGQPVDKSKTLPDGTVITITGVIADDNGLLMYYSIQRPEGSVFDDNRILRYHVDNIQGFLTDSSSKSGSGNLSEDETLFEAVAKFEPVSPFSRTLTATFSEWLGEGELASYPISFKYEANKAMKSIIKQDISQAVRMDEGSIHFDSITASPTATIVKGHFEMPDDEYPRHFGSTKLLVNGIEVKSWGGGSDRYIEEGVLGFILEFDVLPTDQLESIELLYERGEGFQKVDAPVPLDSPSDRSIKVGNEKLWIRSVTKTAAGYDVVIARKQFTILDSDQVFVRAGGKQVPVASVSGSRPWDLNNGNILWENTYSFNTTDKPESLLLDGFYYLKTYNETVTIPLDNKK
ncbi:DUF4179 domain-containing protein [Paenibacillus lemnae]|uniref:DUF4179 domain-containing protein n=1 Tax=Paenibacillus lemnae TaxID=1330551 RepID=A0A848M2I5_PAELE|nr:DUF4179 domain-containing protein [Paenibacillus lemnae]NMO94461.1 DUF4179 domain-containing protein [Paenibacillus lemnae]